MLLKNCRKINFSKTDKDVNGLAFQKFLGRHAKGGRGQFFTPDPVIDFCVQIIQPKPYETIIDPACGTGGFLFSTLNYIKRKYKEENIADYIKNKIFGIEINQRVSQIAKIKFLLEANADPNIISKNSLECLNSILFPRIRGKSIANTFDIVLTNPPFGTQGKISQENTLSKYELGHKWEKQKDMYFKSKSLLKGQVPDVLFVEQCINLLKPGGRMGIVLPNGHFENASMEYVRQYIKNKTNVIGVVLLPQETFIPYGTGVKASLLFLQKKNSEVINNSKVFFSKINKLGYIGNKNGTPVYKKNKTGDYLLRDGNKVIDEDFGESIKDYKDFLIDSFINSDKSFSIDSTKLNARFDYNYYLPQNRKLIETLVDLNAVKLGEVVDVVKNKSSVLRKEQIVEYVEIIRYLYEII